jgi:hypothetical protein
MGGFIEFAGAWLRNPVQRAVRDCFQSPRITTVAIVLDVAMLIIVTSRRRRSNVLRNNSAGHILCRQTWVGLGLAALSASHT